MLIIHCSVFLADQPNYGYELKKRYDMLFGLDKPILSGQIYSTLSRLKRDGKVREIRASTTLIYIVACKFCDGSSGDLTTPRESDYITYRPYFVSHRGRS